MHSRQYISPRGFRAALGGAAAALTIGAGLLALAPHAAHAQAAPGDTFTSLYDFSGTDGANSYGGLVEGNDGNFYGVTYSGGANGNGEVFQVTSSGTLTVLYSFTGGADGKNPFLTPTLGSDGEIYGATQYGGVNNDGTLFKITTAGAFTTIYTFSGSDGEAPDCDLLQGIDGNFYGVTEDGGSGGSGTVFQFNPATSTVTTLHGFDGADGGDPFSKLVEDANGNFYGTTPYGGANSDGVIFEISSAGVESTLYSFTGAADGGNPYGGLVLGTDGNYYDTTSSGGANNTGTVFRVTPSGTLTPIYAFSASGATDGEEPQQGLILGTDGNFYGTTSDGGADNDGTVFQITPSGTLTTLYSFTGGTDGSNPEYNPVVEGTDGSLYGLTIGGTSGDGTVYKLSVPSLIASVNSNPGPTPAGSGVRFDFNGDGHSDLLWYNTASGDVSTWFMNDQSVLAFNPSFATVAPSSGWQPVASTDVNSDGWPDLFWWNSITGEMSIWTMAGTSVVQYGADFATIANTSWMPVAVANENGPSYQLVFQNAATGDISRWTMQGESVTGYGGTIASLGPNSPWHVVGAPDLDGDQKSDLLFWNSQTGEVSYWGCDLANSQVLSFNGDIAQVSDTDWHLVGSEDTNGDGYSDLIWWNASTGEVSRWLMHGTAVASYGADFAQESDTTWQPTAIR